MREQGADYGNNVKLPIFRHYFVVSLLYPIWVGRSPGFEFVFWDPSWAIPVVPPNLCFSSIMIVICMPIVTIL